MKILIPTDFSENAEHATRFALEIARKTGGELFVLHAYDLPYSERSMTTSLLEEMRLNAEQNMQEYDEKFLQTTGVKYATKVVMGNPIRQVKEMAEAKHIDLIVMGTKGASGLEEFLIGSNAASVIHNVDIPVLIIPSQAEKKEFKKIVFATDLDLKNKTRPLERLRDLARIMGASVEILHYQHKHGSEAGNRNMVEEVLGDVEHSYSICKMEEDLQKSILEHCKRKNADIVAAVTKQYGFFEGLFHKSLVSKLAYHTTIPMLALHEPKQ